MEYVGRSGGTPTPNPDPGPGPSPDPDPGIPGQYPSWNPNTVYTNEIVTHNGQLWQAQWWTQNQEPGTTGQWGPWQPVGDAPAPNPSPDPTPNPDPNPTPSPDPDPGTPGQYPSWDSNTIYTNEIVTHNGQLWQAQWYTQNQEPGASQWGPWQLVN
nr:carbohydrate-binding protein [Bacillus alkalicellulosilyticus]